MKNLRVAGIVNDSITDGPGLRYVLFVQGCCRNCPGCHNPQTHDSAGGKDMSGEEILEQIRENPLLDGVTFSGGEPFLQAEALCDLASALRELGLNLIVYTGYLWEELLAAPEKISENAKFWRPLLEKIDILVDGPYVASKKNYELRFRGSTNQRAIDVQQSLKSHKIVEYPL